MNTLTLLVIASCIIQQINSSSLLVDYALKKVNQFGLKLDPNSLASSFYSKVDKCMEDGNVTRLPLSPECLGSLFDLINPFKALSVKPYPYPDEVMVYLQWTELGKMLDSWGKIPDDIFFGNINWLGSYQQCNRLPNAKYCLLNFYFPDFEKSFGDQDVLLGACIPKKCTTRDLNVVAVLAARETNHLIRIHPSICEKPLEYSKGNVIVMLVILALLTLSVTGAIIEEVICKPNRDPDDGTYSEEKNKATDDAEVNNASKVVSTQEAREDKNDGTVGTDETTYNAATAMAQSVSTRLLKQDQEVPSDQRAFLVELISSFSLTGNIEEMTSTKVKEGSIHCINGLRVILTCVITTGHFYNIIFDYNEQVNKWGNSRFWFLAIANILPYVDGFFVLGGVLVSYLTLKWLDAKTHLKLKDLLFFYLHRYIRLTPPVAMIIIFKLYILPLIETGPMAMYRNEVKPSTENCEKYWWTNLLYVNNFYPGHNKNCISSTWYIAVDMQMYIVSPFVLILIKYSTRKSTGRVLGAFKVSAILIIISFVIRAYVTYSYNLPAAALYTPSEKQRSEKDYIGFWDHIYVKPYTRFGPYVVGMFTGYLISRKVTIHDDTRKFVLSAIGWPLCITVLCLVTFGPYRAFMLQEFSDIEILSYSTFSTVGLAISFAWVIYACHNDMGGVINSFLSWPGWVPLSRISYGAYLWHPIVCAYYSQVQERHLHYEERIIVFMLTGVVVVSYALGAVFCIFVEIPVANLSKKLFSR